MNGTVLVSLVVMLVIIKQAFEKLFKRLCLPAELRLGPVQPFHRESLN